jgi:hypothetical protein
VRIRPADPGSATEGTIGNQLGESKEGLMHRALITTGIVVLSALAVVALSRPEAVKAGHTPGLSGRTHLIVKEHNLKRFTTGSLPPSATISSHPCFEVSRTGVVSPTPFVVPAGTVLVITDVQATGTPSAPTGAWLDSASGVISWAFGTGASASPSTHLTGGFALDPGTSLAFLTFNASLPHAVHVIGYLTVDVP